MLVCPHPDRRKKTQHTGTSNVTGVVVQETKPTSRNKGWEGDRLNPLGVMEFSFYTGSGRKYAKKAF